MDEEVKFSKVISYDEWQKKRYRCIFYDGNRSYCNAGREDCTYDRCPFVLWAEEIL